MYPIALITDFGEKDWFVPVMKAVICSVNPGAHIIDVTHQIAPQNTTEAAFVLWNAARQFPMKTVFVAVVDPAVGSQRMIIAAETSRHIYLAPSNGVLDMALSDDKVIRSVAVENKKYFLKMVSRTFHGRDIFAPVAAYLSKGLDLSELGSAIKFSGSKSFFVEASTRGGYAGSVIYIDRFGNLITNLKAESGAKGSVAILGKHLPLAGTYCDVARGKLLAYVGSSGLLEIAVRDGNAQKKLHGTYGMKVKVKIV